MPKEHWEEFVLGKEELQKPAPGGDHQREQSGGGRLRLVNLPVRRDRTESSNAGDMEERYLTGIVHNGYKKGRKTIFALCFHRTGDCNAFCCFEKQCCNSSQHQYYECFCRNFYFLYTPISSVNPVGI